MKLFRPPTALAALLTVLVLSPSVPQAWANKDKDTKVPAENFDAVYRDLEREYESLREKLPAKLLKSGKTAAKAPPRLPKETAKLRERYFEIKELKEAYDLVFDLKEKLTARYFETPGGTASREEVNAEAVRIAAGVMPEIARLKESYKSIFIPIFHNMMIDVGVRKRGACKHWAEDLLAYLRTVPREHFYVTWGEAHAKKFTEHNVAVVYPAHGKFEDGLMIDPWRTSGRPWWARVTQDPHYPWRQWDLYGVY